mmetsp:Transcript_44532/g.142808  ORF Transcript_44532/g.142808 Transcript_44532/m.142808 type:complete len:395 (+) Transcript_44532:272-1456(+)
MCCWLKRWKRRKGTRSSREAHDHLSGTVLDQPDTKSEDRCYVNFNVGSLSESDSLTDIANSKAGCQVHRVPQALNPPDAQVVVQATQMSPRVRISADAIDWKRNKQLVKVTIGGTECPKLVNQISLWRDPAVLNSIRPLFKDGTWVECYSDNHGTWLIGHLQVFAAPARVPAQEAPEELQVVYNVHFENRALRSKVDADVPLHRIRLPLRATERVEVYSDIGAWEPAVVVQQKAKGSYKIRLESDQFEGTFEVPSACLRRRFLPGRACDATRARWMVGRWELWQVSQSLMDRGSRPFSGPKASSMQVVSPTAVATSSSTAVTMDKSRRTSPAMRADAQRSVTRSASGMWCPSSTSACVARPLLSCLPCVQPGLGPRTGRCPGVQPTGRVWLRRE